MQTKRNALVTAQLAPYSLKKGVLVGLAFYHHLLAEYPHAQLLDLLLVIHNESVSQVIALGIVIAEVCQVSTLPEVSEHVIDVIDRHVHRHHR